METRQPDPTRTLGEEAIGALTRLHASKSKNGYGYGCANAFFATLPIFVYEAYGPRITPFLLERFGGSRDDWFLAIAAVTFTIVSLIRCWILSLVHIQPERIILKRGSTSISPPISHSQIWRGIFIRVIAPILSLCMTLWLFSILLSVSTPIQKTAMASSSAFFFYVAVSQIATLFHPLIRVDDDGVQVKRRELLWSNIERLQIENNRQDTTTRWQFFDAKGKRTASVDLSETSFLLQKQVISAIVDALSATIEEFPPYKPVTDDSYRDIERPY